MNFIDKVEGWGDKHHPKWLDALRILLGIVLFWKGYYFISHTDELTSMIESSKAAIFPEIMTHYVALAHIFGGILITVGLMTRLAILFQLPVLIGAIVFVELRNGFLSIHSDLLLAILVLFLLVFFLVEGSGPISMDDYLKRHHPEDL